LYSDLYSNILEVFGNTSPLDCFETVMKNKPDSFSEVKRLMGQTGRLRERGEDIFKAVEHAAVHRFRPILLTTLTTFIGLMPIMAERSIDAQFLKPAVLALAFGVLFALFVTLLMVPALYCIGEDLRAALSRLWRRLRGISRDPVHSP